MEVADSLSFCIVIVGLYYVLQVQLDEISRSNIITYRNGEYYDKMFFQN